MDLNRALDNRKLSQLLEEYIECFWYDFHGGTINDEDEAYDYMHEFIDRSVTYTYECEQILDGNSEYHYLDHEVFGRPSNIAQAAYACVYDYFQSSPDLPRIENAIHELQD